MTNPTAAQLRKFFEYDPLTGEVRNLITRGRAKAGNVAGTLSDDGYLVVMFLGQNERLHRIIWCMQTGVWPELLIDHEDGNGLNNRWRNLREASTAENGQNLNATSARTGRPLGVSPLPSGRWRARIKVDYREKHIGVFPTEAEAHQAYAAAKARLHLFSPIARQGDH